MQGRTEREGRGRTQPEGIWFTKGIRVTSALIEEVRRGERYRTIASHTQRNASMMAAAEVALLEPGQEDDAGAQGSGYSEWLLHESQRLNVSAIFAGSKLKLLANQREALGDAGVTLIVPANAETLEVIDDKVRFLAGWDTSILPVPAWTTFQDAKEFTKAADQLQSTPPTWPSDSREGENPSSFTCGSDSMKGLRSTGMRRSASVR